MAALRATFSMVVAVGLVTLGAAAPASAELSRVGVVTTLDGTATLSRVALPQGVPLKIRDDVFVADRIVTGDKSFARILLGGKAIVTVRERSVLNITEAPGTSTIDVSIGRVAVAVVKERMKPGESVEIRTPNAVAGIRGTVVVAEVNQATSQLHATSASFTTTITVLKGRIEFRPLDRLTRQPTGPGVAVGALQSIRVTGFAVPRPVQKVPGDVQQQLINDFRVPLRTASTTTTSTIAEGQLRQAISAAGAQLGALNPAAPDRPATAVKEDDQRASGKNNEDNEDSKTSADSSKRKTGGDEQRSTAKAKEDNEDSKASLDTAKRKPSGDDQRSTVSSNSNGSRGASSSATAGSTGNSGAAAMPASATTGTAPTATVPVTAPVASAPTPSAPPAAKPMVATTPTPSAAPAAKPTVATAPAPSARTAQSSISSKVNAQKASTKAKDNRRR